MIRTTLLFTLVGGTLGIHAAQGQVNLYYGSGSRIVGSSTAPQSITNLAGHRFPDAESTSFFLTSSGGGGGTNGGLDDSSAADVVSSRLGIQAMTSPPSATSTYRRGYVVLHGEARNLNPAAYPTAFMQSSLSSQGSSAIELNADSSTPMTLFIEARGRFSGVESLNDGQYRSGSIVPSDHFQLPDFAINALVDSQTFSQSFDGSISIQFVTNPCPWIWTQRATSAPTAPPQRFLASAAFDRAHDRVVLFGGLGATPLNDLWDWDGNSWTLRQDNGPGSATRPSARFGAAMFFNTNDQKFYLFGGETPSFSREFWRLDPVTWTWTNLSAAPPTGHVPATLAARSRHAIAFDRDRGVAVMYGGRTNGTTASTETWEHNGSVWALRTPATNPGARDSNALAYDPTRGGVILFGGGPVGTTPLPNTTFLWDGTVWGQLTTLGNPKSPVGRWGPGLVFDESRGRIVVHGGATSPPTVGTNEVWELVQNSNGDNVWNNVTASTANGLSARASHAMVYDSAHSGIVVFSGAGQSDTWVMSSPQISKHPVSQNLIAGQTLTLTAAASGTAQSWQWFRGLPPYRVRIPGANSSTFQIPNAQPANSGAYSVDAIFSCGEQTSNTATITINSCYANCDGSGVLPVLTANDFICFLSKYASGCT